MLSAAIDPRAGRAAGRLSVPKDRPGVDEVPDGDEQGQVAADRPPGAGRPAVRAPDLEGEPAPARPPPRASRRRKAASVAAAARRPRSTGIAVRSAGTRSQSAAVATRPTTSATAAGNEHVEKEARIRARRISAAIEFVYIVDRQFSDERVGSWRIA